MNYNDVKRKYNVARREQLLVDKEINRVKKEISLIEPANNSAYKNYEATVLQERKRALESYRKEKTRAIEEKLCQCEQSLQQFKQEYQAKRKEITYDNLLTQCSSKWEILDEVRESTDTLQKSMQRILGCHLFEAVSEQIEQKSIDLEQISLEKIIRYFNASSKTIERYCEKDGVFATALSKLEDALTKGVEDDPRGKAGIGALSLIVLLASLFFGKYIFTTYFIFLVIIVFYNVTRNYSIYKILIIQKAVKDNIDQIDALLKEQVETEVEVRSKKLQEKYEKLIEEKENELTQLRNQLGVANVEAESTFTFDEKVYKEQYNSEVERNEERKSQLMIRLKQLQADLAEKTEIAAEAAENMKGMLANLQDQYLVGVGNDVLFNTQFLFDIDIDKNRPDFFVHPETSCLFLYEELQDVYNFIRLICVQLRARLNPFNLNITAVDTVNMGQELIYFAAKSSGGADDVSSLFNIITDNAELKTWGKSMANDLIRRMQNISREFKDIKGYNQKMVELQSLTESYDFSFLIDPSVDFLNGDEMEKLLRNGGALGVFVHVFYQKDSFIELKERANSLLNKVGRAYVLENGAYFERAKDFIIENYLSEEQ